MKNIHFICQGKGGVGKTFVSNILTQQRLERGKKVACFDSDPGNASFYAFESLNVTRIDIMDGDDINVRKFDELVESIAKTKADEIIVDNGASSFIPMISYILSNNLFEVLTEMGLQVYIHTVINGGQNQRDTLTGFDALIAKLGNKNVKFVVWENQYFGEVEHAGKKFVDMKVFKDHADKVDAVVVIPEVKKETFGADIRDMLQNRQTFDEAINSKNTQIMVKQRLKTIRDTLYANIDVVFDGVAEETAAEEI